MFLAPLIFIVWFLHPILDAAENGKSISDGVLIWRGVLSVPVSAISLFGWSSIRLNRRLYEEYNHKQRVMQLYRSFKEEISKIDPAGDEYKALIAIMLGAVADKPTLAMSEYDKDTPALSPVEVLRNWVRRL